MSLEALQTPSCKELKEKGMSLIDHYASIIIERKEPLQELSKYLAVDGYFAKKNFIESILKQTDLQIICKLRSDANLWYPYQGTPTGKRGRPKQYTHKMEVKNPYKDYFTLCCDEKELKIYEGIMYCKMLHRKIKIAYAERWKKGEWAIHHPVFY